MKLKRTKMKNCKNHYAIFFNSVKLCTFDYCNEGSILARSLCKYVYLTKLLLLWFTYVNWFTVHL